METHLVHYLFYWVYICVVALSQTMEKLLEVINLPVIVTTRLYAILYVDCHNYCNYLQPHSVGVGFPITSHEWSSFLMWHYIKYTNKHRKCPSWAEELTSKTDTWCQTQLNMCSDTTVDWNNFIREICDLSLKRLKIHLTIYLKVLFIFFVLII